MTPRSETVPEPAAHEPVTARSLRVIEGGVEKVPQIPHKLAKKVRMAVAKVTEEISKETIQHSPRGIRAALIYLLYHQQDQIPLDELTNRLWEMVRLKRRTYTMGSQYFQYKAPNIDDLVDVE